MPSWIFNGDTVIGKGVRAVLRASRLFPDLVLRMPGIRLVSRPAFGWRDVVSSQKLRKAVVECDRKHLSREGIMPDFSNDFCYLSILYGKVECLAVGLDPIEKISKLSNWTRRARS